VCIMMAIWGRRWAGHVARIEMCTEFWWGNVNEQDHLDGLGLDGGMILKWILNK
jgi:hypothetical protein